MELREHFGACEHFYGHWIDLNMPHGRFPLWQLMVNIRKSLIPNVVTLLHDVGLLGVL